MKCLFCNLSKKEIIFRFKNFIFVTNKFPILKGHSMLISKRHIRSEVNFNNEEWEEYKNINSKCYKYIKQKFNFFPTVFINAPQDQSIKHFHKHFIPGKFGILGVDKALRKINES